MSGRVAPARRRSSLYVDLRLLLVHDGGVSADTAKLVAAIGKALRRAYPAIQVVERSDPRAITQLLSVDADAMQVYGAVIGLRMHEGRMRRDGHAIDTITAHASRARPTLLVDTALRARQHVSAVHSGSARRVITIAPDRINEAATAVLNALQALIHGQGW